MTTIIDSLVRMRINVPRESNYTWELVKTLNFLFIQIPLALLELMGITSILN